MLTKSVGKRLKEFRQSKGINQHDFGKLVGVSYYRISAYENGADIGLEMLEKLSKKLDIQPWDLIKPEDPQKAVDPSLAEITSIWPTLNDEQKRIILAVTRTLNRGVVTIDHPVESPAKKKKI